MSRRTHTQSRWGWSSTVCGKRVYTGSVESKVRTHILLAEDGADPTCKPCRVSLGLDPSPKLGTGFVGKIRKTLKTERVIVPDHLNVLLDLLEDSGLIIGLKWLPPVGAIFKPQKRYTRRSDARRPGKTGERAVLEVFFETEPVTK